MTAKTKAKPAPEALLLEITLKHFPNIETLETRNWDRLDFHDVSIWSIHDALAATYAAGQADAKR
jgi:uncharacterized protein DUF6900